MEGQPSLTQKSPLEPDSQPLEYYRRHREEIDLLIDKQSLFILVLIHRKPNSNVAELNDHVGIGEAELTRICAGLRGAGIIGSDTPEGTSRFYVLKHGAEILRLLSNAASDLPESVHHSAPISSLEGPRVRRNQLFACFVGMIAISSCQYAWTLFTTPLTARLHLGLAQVQWAFCFFVFTQVLTAFLFAYPVDLFGPRRVVAFSGALVGIGWIGAGLATGLTGLYFAQAIAGIGAGAAYGACMGTAMKWFPDKRGISVGVVAGAYVLGAAITGWPISLTIRQLGDAKAFIIWGAIHATMVMISAQWLTTVPSERILLVLAETREQLRSIQKRKDYTPVEMLKTPTFWLLYAMMTMGLVGGMMITVQLEPMAGDYSLRFYMLLGGISSLGLSFLVNRIMNFLSRVFFGGISDRIGRYNALLLAFGLQLLAVVGLLSFPQKPWYFIILSGVLFFAWGEIFVLYPSMIADMYGSQFATTNYGIQYTSKFVASLLAAPGAAWLYKNGGGSWRPVLLATGLCSLAACMLALAFRKTITGSLNQLRVALVPGGPVLDQISSQS